MSQNSLILHIGEDPEIQAFLADRIYEFNSKATGYFDGESFSATQRGESGDIRAGICGYTWGGCCYISYLWVHETERGHGLGAGLLLTAEGHAKERGCKVMFVATHSFQAPSFYKRFGYTQRAVVQDHPVGHASLMFAKDLSPGKGAEVNMQA